MTQGDRSGKHRNWIALSVALVCAAISGLMTGCGAPAAPQPPTLNLPQPVRDLAARRAGDTVYLTFSVPQKTTDKLPVRGLMTAKLCRSVDGGPCEAAGALSIPAQQKSSSMEDNLPPALTQGSPRLLTYKISILNRAEKSDGDSGPAYAVAGAAPAPVADFSVTPGRKGIILSWRAINVAPGATGWVQFERTRISGPSSPPRTRESLDRNPLTGRKTPEEAAEQIFRVPEDAAPRPPFAIDVTAHTGNSYRYAAQRILQVTVAGRTVEIASPTSAPVEAAYRDVFPPPVPIGLVSAADTTSKAIDLDWTPDVDPGLAGYIVYRRAVGTNETPQHISPAKPVTTSTWSDTTAVPGQRYAYSVSAIDLSGNESQRSAEIEDGWNTPGSQPNSQPTSSSSPHSNPHP